MLGSRGLRQTIPMGRVIRFAIATAMRQEEMFRVTWDDYAALTYSLDIASTKASGFMSASRRACWPASASPERRRLRTAWRR